MAKGYPDFFGFSIFPQYGSFSVEDLPVEIIADGDNFDIINVLGKGVVHSGDLTLSCDGNPLGISIQISIDGQDLAQEAPPWLLRHGFGPGVDTPIICTEYDPSQGRYTIVLHTNVSFVTSFIVNVKNNSGENCVTYGYLYWSKVV